MNGHKPVGAMYYIFLTMNGFFILFNVFNLITGAANTPWLAAVALVLNTAVFIWLRIDKPNWEMAFERRMKSKDLQS